MTTIPKVSVVMPCYNDGKYIGKAIESIVAQGYTNWELIVVDDGSTDPLTIEKLNSLNYPKTKVLKKLNGGVSTARNYGFRHSKGKYILPFDSDDVFEDTFIEKAVQVLENDESIGVVTCYERFFADDDFERTIFTWEPCGGGVTNFLTKNNANGNSLMRFRCWEAVGGYDEQLPSHEDWDFWIKVTSRGWRVHTIPEVLFHYRRAQKSKHKKNVHRKPEFVKRIVENNLEVYEKHVVLCLFQKEEEILRLREKNRDRVNRIKESPQYMIGQFIMAPLLIVRKVGEKLRAWAFSRRSKGG